MHHKGSLSGMITTRRSQAHTIRRRHVSIEPEMMGTRSDRKAGKVDEEEMEVKCGNGSKVKKLLPILTSAELPSSLSVPYHGKKRQITEDKPA